LSNGSELTSAAYFKTLIKDDLGMEDNDLMRLNRVTKLDKLKKGQTMPIKVLVQNIEDRAEKSEKMRDETIKTIAKKMEAENITNIESMVQYFDIDYDGLISREELVDGLNHMGIWLPESVIDNVFRKINSSNSG
jgi:beta-N-acetylglucosaminidase